MSEEVKDVIEKLYGDNAVKIKGKIYSQYGGLDSDVREGDYVKFKFTTKEKDGKVYNNIIAGSLEIIQKPKQMTEQQYNQSQEVIKPFPLDKDTLIVRQSCLKSAVEMVTTHPTYKDTNVLELAENFEKWVNRDG